MMIFLPQVNSTNIHAMQRINDGLSVQGEVVWTLHQTNGKGQRAKSWADEQAQSVLMSMVLLENLGQMGLFELNAIVALAVREVIASYIPVAKVRIKWPNDIFIDDKKTCGILIENSFRGSNWHAAVLGIGINVRQQAFSSDLPLATSLYMNAGQEFDLEEIIYKVRESVLMMWDYYLYDKENLLNVYNSQLYKVGQEMYFMKLANEHIFPAKILGVNADGALLLKEEGEMKAYQFGALQWLL